MSLCISNATLVFPEGMKPGGVLCADDGHIEAVLEADDSAHADVEIDAGQKLLFPGFIDAHVHMRDPGYAHKEGFAAGTRAAALGGITTVLCMPNTNPPVTNVAALNVAKDAGAGEAYVDFGLQAAAEPGNITDLAALWDAGVTSFEALMAEVAPEGRTDTPARLHELFTEVARIGGLVGVFVSDQSLIDRAKAAAKNAGENGLAAVADSRVVLSEAVGIASALEVARVTGVRLLIRQVSTMRGFEMVRAARSAADGPNVSAEVTPHHLHIDRRTLDELGAFAFMLPPLRGEEDVEAARAALADGTIDFVASDHAPHLPQEKEFEDAWKCAGGTPGLDTLVPSVLDFAARGQISWPKVADVLAEAPARLSGLSARKGRIAVGMDADLVLVDREERKTVTPALVHSRAARSPFEGRSLTGWPVLTVLRGQIVADGGRLTDGPPRGVWIGRGSGGDA